MTLRVAGLVIAIGAVTAFAFWFCASALRNLVAPAVYPSGGIGAVSGGVAELLVEMILFCGPAIVLNFVLAKRARSWGQSATRLRRLHLLLTTLSLVAIPLTVPPPNSWPWPEHSIWSIVPWGIALLMGSQVVFGVAAITQLVRMRRES
jgi:hypothetical protein